MTKINPDIKKTFLLIYLCLFTEKNVSAYGNVRRDIVTIANRKFFKKFINTARSVKCRNCHFLEPNFSILGI